MPVKRQLAEDLMGPEYKGTVTVHYLAMTFTIAGCIGLSSYAFSTGGHVSLLLLLSLLFVLLLLLLLLAPALVLLNWDSSWQIDLRIARNMERCSA